MIDELSPRINYDQILAVAKEKAAELRPLLPSLPSDKVLEPFLGKMWAVDRPLINTVRSHLDKWGTRSPDRSYEGHLEWVAQRSAYVAALECSERGIMDTNLREEIIQRAWRLGLLHDVEAWRGWTPEHAVEGLKTTRKILEELGIRDIYLEDQVLLHDELNVKPRGNPAFDIPFFSVFAVDHLNWGTEWEETKWKNQALKKVSPETAIKDWKFMLGLKNSPNLQQTKWGREITAPYVNFGINIAQHVEQTFSVKPNK